MIYEVALADGRARRAFALGDPVETGDFEGIASADGRIWLIDSAGRMLVADAGADGTRAAFERFDTGAGEACEIEGLSLAPEPGHLLIACKNMARGERRGRLVIYRWNVETRAPAERWREIDLQPALGGRGDDFAPSSIEWVPALDRLIVVSARDRTLIVLDGDGAILTTHALAAARHPQPEGVAVVGGDRLVIADEGEDGRSARLAVYPLPLPDAGAQ